MTRTRILISLVLLAAVFVPLQAADTGFLVGRWTIPHTYRHSWDPAGPSYAETDGMYEDTGLVYQIHSDGSGEFEVDGEVVRFSWSVSELLDYYPDDGIPSGLTMSWGYANGETSRYSLIPVNEDAFLLMTLFEEDGMQVTAILEVYERVQPR